MNVRDEAFADWQKGMKYREIAEKYNVSLSTVKSWAVRHWKQEAVATKRKKKLQPSGGKLQPGKHDSSSSSGKRGAPLGNHNAVGNSGGGAPKRNQNNLKHGAYSKVYLDVLDAEELEMFLEMLEDVSNDEEYQLEKQIALYTIRERRLLRQIKGFQESGEKSKGQLLKGVVKQKSLEYTGRVSAGAEEKENKNAHIIDTTTTETEAVINTIMILEQELTKVQRAKTGAINALFKIRSEKQKLEGGSKDGELVHTWADAVIKAREGT